MVLSTSGIIAGVCENAAVLVIQPATIKNLTAINPEIFGVALINLLIKIE